MEGKAVVEKDNILWKTLKDYIHDSQPSVCGNVESIKISDIIEVAGGTWKKYKKLHNALMDDIDTEESLISNGWDENKPMMLNFKHSDKKHNGILGSFNVKSGNKRLAWMVQQGLEYKNIPVIFQFQNKYSLFDGLHLRYNGEYIIYHSDAVAYDPDNKMGFGWIPLIFFMNNKKSMEQNGN